MERDLGQMGESTFQLWCSNVGITANPSSIDKYGWDFIVEFPSVLDSTRPLDRSPTPIECKVQVKATDAKNRKIQIKLSTLYRLVQYNGPAFIFLIEFDGNDTPTGAYLKEVGKGLIEKTLYKLRKLEVKGDAKINTKTVTIKFLPDDWCELGGEGLKTKWLRILDCPIEEYIKSKVSYRDKVGYEDGVKEGSFTVSGDGVLMDLIDLSVGIKDSINVDEFKIHDVRFGLKSEQPIAHFNGGEISIPPDMSGEERTVTFFWPSLSLEYSFKAKLYTPFGLVDNLPRHMSKARVVSPLFEIFIEFDEYNAKFNFNINQANDSKVGLKELYMFVHVLKNMQENSLELLKLKLDGGSGSFMDLNGPLEKGSLISESTYALVCAVWDIAKKFHVQKYISVELRELINNYKEINAFYDSVIRKSTVRFEASIALLDNADVCLGERETVVIAKREVSIGGRDFVSVILYKGMALLTNDSISGVDLNYVVSEELVFQYDDSEKDKDISESARILKEQINDSGVIVVSTVESNKLIQNLSD